MLRDEDQVRLLHMLDAVERALKHTQDKSRGDLERDDLLCLALVRLIEIIGEAAKAVSPEVRETYPAIHWKQISGTRDRLIHGYFNVDLDVVWAIITNDLPVLEQELRKIIYR